MYSLPDRNTKAQAVILADGGYPADGTVAAAILAGAEYVVCCDGAADAFVASGGIPDAIVGDCDSLSSATAGAFADRLYPSDDQETNDLTKAFCFCLTHGFDDIIILGATGRREDHTMANISLLADYMEQASVCMVTDYGVFDAVRENARFASFAGQQVSIFTIATDTALTVEGLLYTPPADGLCGWWRGSLNEATGDRFSIFTAGRTIVFRSFV